MNLAKAGLPSEFVSRLRRLNIRDVETLLSMTATNAGLVAIARVLGQPEEDVRTMTGRLARDNPGIHIVSPEGVFHAMGHVPPG